MMRIMRLLRSPQTARPLSLPDRAEADLRFIRGAMERSGSFTAVPGVGGIVMGAVALAAAAAAAPRAGTREWLVVWIAAACVAMAAGILAMRRKAARQGVAILKGPGRRFLLCLCPALFAGAVLTAAILRIGRADLLPTAWLLCYGCGVTAAGAFSTRIVPLTGAAFLALGAVAAVAPPSWGDVLMAAGFGCIHVASGIVVARRHGG
jgi:hypothetical protein